MTLNLLVFGAAGQVGAELCRLDGVAGVAVKGLARSDADLSNPELCARLVADCRADVVVNVAAFTNVDKAETDAALAETVNAVAPGAMARAAAARDLPFLHVSTDYVFDGHGVEPWREQDAPGPLSVYGATKRAGEIAVGEAGGRHAVLRTSWVFSAHGSNFVRTMLRIGRSRPTLSVVDDQHGGPTPAADIAAALVTIARAFVAGRGTSGLFHFSGAPTVTWRGFADAVFQAVDWPEKPTLVPIATSDWPSPAARPLNSRLDCSRIAECYGVSRPDWRAGLDAALVELGERRPDMTAQ